jgi:hypothetical protein
MKVRERRILGSYSRVETIALGPRVLELRLYYT